MLKVLKLEVLQKNSTPGQSEHSKVYMPLGQASKTTKSLAWSLHLRDNLTAQTATTRPGISEMGPCAAVMMLSSWPCGWAEVKFHSGLKYQIIRSQGTALTCKAKIWYSKTGAQLERPHTNEKISLGPYQGEM